MNTRGYFGIGVEGISKMANVGTIARSAYAFGSSFFFTIAPDTKEDINMDEIAVSDTADSFEHMPYYEYENLSEFRLPEGTTLVGVELTDESVDLPSFRHPPRAAYVLGPEMGSLSPELTEKCDFVIKIPMRFCVNVGVAAAIVMYDRQLSLGKFAERPVRTGGSLVKPDDQRKARKIHRRRIRGKKKTTPAKTD